MTRLMDWLWKAFFYLGIQVVDRIPRRVVPVRQGLTGPKAEEPGAHAPSMLDMQRAYNGALSDQADSIAKQNNLVTPDRPELWFASPAEQVAFALAAARARARFEKKELEAKRDRAIAEDIEELLGRVNYEDPR